MIIRKNMTNGEIYTTANNLLDAFKDISDLKLPVKIHFYFLKNMNSIVDMGQDIEKARMEIVEKYGNLNEDGQSYNIPEDKIEQANQDISDLFSLEQEVKVHTFPLEWLDGIELDAKQVNAFSFMIDDEEEERE